MENFDIVAEMEPPRHPVTPVWLDGKMIDDHHVLLDCSVRDGLPNIAFCELIATHRMDICICSD
jgi:hypothetical protein